MTLICACGTPSRNYIAIASQFCLFSHSKSSRYTQSAHASMWTMPFGSLPLVNLLLKRNYISILIRTVLFSDRWTKRYTVWWKYWKHIIDSVVQDRIRKWVGKKRGQHTCVYLGHLKSIHHSASPTQACDVILVSAVALCQCISDVLLNFCMYLNEPMHIQMHIQYVWVTCVRTCITPLTVHLCLLCKEECAAVHCLPLFLFLLIIT